MMSADKPSLHLHVFCGEFGDYLIPENIYSQVKRWNKNGWPDRRFKEGPRMFLEWVKAAEEAERKRLFMDAP